MSTLAARSTDRPGAWPVGGGHAIATRMIPVAERLCDAAGIRARDRVLDVACGTGTAALAAARRGAHVTGVDLASDRLRRARVRADAEALPVALVEGDAEALPFTDAAFDAVVSTAGVMFAADQERAADELLRVCRPGGTMALAAWTPEGFMGRLLRLVGRHDPRPSAPRSPSAWGSENRVRELLAGAAAIRCRPRVLVLRFADVETFVDRLLDEDGPTATVAARLDARARDAFRDALGDLVHRADDEIHGSLAVDAAYLEVLATR